jgi:mono/diheme cytochrome c family protein
MTPPDFLLERPVSEQAIGILRFAAFSLHLLFVLVTLGTAILSIAYFVNSWWRGKLNELRWDKEILRTFLAHKSLAVVLGVGPLLLIQVGHPVPFFSAINLMAPAWLLLIVLLVIAFLCMDFLGQRIEVHHYLHLVLGVVGQAALLAVPGIFVAVLVTAEHPERWAEIAANGYRLPLGLTIHWLFRYLHVLGASVVFAGLFHYFWSRPDETAKRASLLRWVAGGILFQFVLGVMLQTSMPRAPDFSTSAAVGTGVAGGVWLTAVVFRALVNRTPLNLVAAAPAAVVLLLGMLLARQFNQDRAFVPLTREADRLAVKYRERLAPYRSSALAIYEEEVRGRPDGQAVYTQSCAFCHGENADGRAAEARNLAIPAENLAEMRTTREHLRRVLLEGVPGTAMPRFGYFTRPTLDSVIDYLDEQYHVLQAAGPVPRDVAQEARQEARRIYDTACSVCHGPGGAPTELSRGFQPPPPNFSVYSMTPHRAFDVITNGYAGTMMPGFESVPQEVRWGLVEIVLGFPAQRTAQ